MPVDGLHDRDVIAWAGRESALLRRVAAGERVNAEVDWAHVIEEVFGVGLAQLRACRSQLQQGIRHLLRIHAWPGSRSVEHWRDEAWGLLSSAENHFAPSMRQRIRLDKIYAAALRQARDGSDHSGPPRALPDRCPFTLEELLRADTRALEAVLVRLG